MNLYKSSFNSMQYKRKIKELLLRIGVKRLDPYIELNHELEAIFVHIPKVAGISVTKTIFGQNVNHRSAREYQLFNPKAFKRYYSFTFVRNPWDRFVSAFEFLSHGGRNKKDKIWAEQYIAGLSFDSFMEKIATDSAYKKSIMHWQHFRPQVEYVCNQKGKVLVDFVGRFESLEKDFQVVCNTLGLEKTLPHLNKTRERASYQSYFSEEQKRIVGDMYQQDIFTFGYRFE